MSTLLNLGRDVAGANSYTPTFCDNKFSATLAVGVERTFTVPSNFKVWTCVFSLQPGTVVWVARNATAAVPAGGTFAATTSELNPATRTVYAGDVIHLITSSATADVGVQLYAIS